MSTYRYYRLSYDRMTRPQRVRDLMEAISWHGSRPVRISR